MYSLMMSIIKRSRLYLLFYPHTTIKPHQMDFYATNG
jgi:hypothetical protein